MRVLLAEDSLLLRAGVARLLEDEGFEVVGEAGDLDDLLRKVRAHKPDVAIVDIKMPPTHTDEGLQAALIIRSELPGTGVLVLSQYVEKEYAAELAGRERGGRRLPAQRPGGRPRTVRRRRPARGRGRIRARSRGRVPNACPPVGRAARSADASGAGGARPDGGRTLELLDRDELVVTERAVEKHVTSIFSKLDLPATAEGHRRVLAVLAYLNS